MKTGEGEEEGAEEEYLPDEPAAPALLQWRRMAPRGLRPLGLTAAPTDMAIRVQRTGKPFKAAMARGRAQSFAAREF